MEAPRHPHDEPATDASKHDASKHDQRDTAPGGPGGGDVDPMERADRANGEPAATDD
jgi:hypothetical protein